MKIICINQYKILRDIWSIGKNFKKHVKLEARARVYEGVRMYDSTLKKLDVVKPNTLIK